jgi:hypothetical protein
MADDIDGSRVSADHVFGTARAFLQRGLALKSLSCCRKAGCDETRSRHPQKRRESYAGRADVPAVSLHARVSNAAHERRRNRRHVALRVVRQFVDRAQRHSVALALVERCPERHRRSRLRPRTRPRASRIDHDHEQYWPDCVRDDRVQEALRRSALLLHYSPHGEG